MNIEPRSQYPSFGESAPRFYLGKTILELKGQIRPGLAGGRGRGMKHFEMCLSQCGPSRKQLTLEKRRGTALLELVLKVER
jgi:hypothetical protein